MKKFFPVILLLIAVQQMRSQNLLQMHPDSSVSGIMVQKISGDKNSTSFLIWIKHEVKPHKHEKHTENIYILEGEGEMKLNGKSIVLRSGDYVHVPEDAVHSVKVLSSVPLKLLSVQSPEFNGDDRIFINE